MAKICVQCDKKIGLFKSPVDGIYCSTECRDAAKRDIADNDRRAAERQVEQARAEQEAAVHAAEQAAQARVDAATKSTCPKCGTAWKFVEGSGGTHHGDCTKCGLSTDFVRIEKCPTCTGMSLVVAPDGARCPRCKYRVSAADFRL